MSNSNLEFKLNDISSSYDTESDYFTLQADIKPLSYENIFILSAKILSYQDDVIINASENTLMLFENKDDVCGIYDAISENGNINPNKFDVIYKIFDLIEKNTLNLKLPGPPELSRKGGSFIVHQPERNFIGSNKWKFGSISIESIVIRKLEDSFEMYFNIENKDFLSSIPIIEVKGKNWTQKTEPILAQNSKFQVSLNIYEEIDSSDFEFNFMFFEQCKSEKLSDQVVPEPMIEDNNNDNDEFVEDVKEIIVGNTYNVSAYNRNSLTEITQYENIKTKKMLNVETMWKNGNFTITIKNDEEKEELQNCIGDDGDVFDYERYEDIELEDYFDDKSSEFIYWNSCGIDEKEQEHLEDEFQNSSSHIRQDFLEEKGFDSLFTNYQIHGGLVVNQVGESASEKDNNNDVPEDKVDLLEEENTTIPTNFNENEDKISSLDTNSFFKHNVMLVSIGKSLSENKKIYDAARYAWDAKKERAEKMEYVIAHQSGKIVGIFKPEKWLFADDEEFSDFPEADSKRIGFIGNVADSEILLEYLNKDIPSEYRPKGASNPVRYIELEKSNTKTEKKNKKSKVSSKEVKKSDVKEFGWWNIHKGYDENDIDQYICEFYEIKDDLDENGEEIVDEDGYSSTQKDDGWGNLYNPKITMEMVMSIETFLQKYIDEYDGDFGETDMGSALKEWIAKYTSHVQHDPPWDYPDRNYKMWD